MKLGIGTRLTALRCATVNQTDRSLVRETYGNILVGQGQEENFTTSRRVVWDLLAPGNLVTSLTCNP